MTETAVSQKRPVRGPWKNRTGLVLALPMIIFLVGVVAFPLLHGIWISLTNKSLMSSAADFVGLANYATVLLDQEFQRSVLFTVGFAIAATAFEVAAGVGIAIFFQKLLARHRSLVLLIIIPITIAPALISVMFRLLLNENIGLATALLANVGIEVSLFDPEKVVGTLLVLELLHWTPFVVLICYAALQAFPTEVHEAGQVDGANPWRLTWHITLPLLKPVIFSAAFLRFVDTVRIFDVINVLTGGGPGTSTQTLSIYIYKKAFHTGSFGVAAAAGVMMLVVMSLLIPVLVRSRGEK